MKHYVGIDVAKEKLDIYGIDQHQKSLNLTARIPNTIEGIRRLLEELPTPSKTVIMYESTGAYSKKLAPLLMPKVALVCEVNPKVIKNAKLTMTQTKTDPCDAMAIAHAARHLYLTKPKTMEKWAINPHRDPELAVWISEFNRLHKEIARHLQQVDTLEQLPGQAARIVAQRITQELQLLKQSKKEIKKMIESTARDEEVALVSSITGIGTITAATLINRIGNIDRFESADSLKGYLGIYPCHKQTGKRKGKAHIAKNGDRLIRHQLFNCAKVAARFNPVCQALYEKKVSETHSSLYAWIAVMRKLVQLVYGVLKNKTPWDPNYGLTGNG